jgi:hypothetical protein
MCVPGMKLLVIHRDRPARNTNMIVQIKAALTMT